MNRNMTKTSGQDWVGLWLATKERMRRELGDAVYDAWLAQLSLLSFENSELKIAAPRMFIRNWVANQYLSRIERALRAEGAEPASISIVLAPASVGGALTREEIPRLTPAVSHLPLAPRVPEPADARGGIFRRELEPTQTFETFVASGTNELVRTAARAFALDEPAAADVPLLFIHGTFGVGKTHLLNAMTLAARAKGRKAVLLSSETFMCSFLGALKSKETLEFKEELRSAEMLLVDDLQHLCRSTYTVSEFLHTLNAFSDLRRKFVIAADSAPAGLEGLTAEVRSRLSGGLVLGLEKPDRATRLAILSLRASGTAKEHTQIAISESALARIADIEDTTPRDLIGIFSKLALYAGVTKNAASCDSIVDMILRGGASVRRTSIEEIQRKAAEFYHLDLRDFISKQRSRRVARPRQIAMYLSRKLTERSLPEIGRRFGGRDHTTVLHACRRVEALCDADPMFRQEVEFLKDVLNKPA